MNKQISIDALAAAALTASGSTQTEIAAQLHISQSAVSRMLRHAQEYIQVERKFHWEKLSPSAQAQVRRKISGGEAAQGIAELAKRSGQHVPEIHVVPLDTGSDLAAQFDTFAVHAAVVLRELLEQVRGRVGVAWGSTLWATTQALGTVLRHGAPRHKTPIEFIPLCGDPLIDSQERFADRTSSRIVSELSKLINGDNPRPAWLGLVPAYIPRPLDEDEIRVIDRLIDLVPQYSRIFGPRIATGPPNVAPLASDLDMIITAAGSSSRPLGFGRNPLLGLSEEESGLLAESIHGDIGGVLLPKSTGPVSRGEQPQIHPLVEELTNRWTGLKIEHVKSCALRASAERSKSRPGVMLLSFGASHVDVTLEAIKRGLINVLVIGSDLEEAILHALRN